MKNIFSIIAIAVSGMAFSQVIIGDKTGTVPAGQKQSVLLEFEQGKNKGIILPYVRTMPSGTGFVEGTIVLDATTPDKARVKYYAPGNALAATDGWVDLSNGHDADITNEMNIQPTTTEDATAKVIIGAESSNANGVLVLESDSKAMVLPMVEDTNDVPDPAPGMMVYINKAGAKRLAVYNGGGWTYWKPE